MGERDMEADEIIAGVMAYLRGEPVIAASVEEPSAGFLQTGSDKSVEADLIRRGQAVFIRQFMSASIKGIGNNSEPEQIAPDIRDNFERSRKRHSKLYRLRGDHRLAQAIEDSTLGDLEKYVVGEIDDMEHLLGSYSGNSTEYRTIERYMRKLDKLQMAAHIAQSL